MLLDETLCWGQNMAILVELQSVLRRMGQRVERRGPHVLGSKMVLMLHRWRELLVLVETGRHHPSSAGLGLDCTTRQGRIGLNGDGGGRKRRSEIRWKASRAVSIWRGGEVGSRVVLSAGLGEMSSGWMLQVRGRSTLLFRLARPCP